MTTFIDCMRGKVGRGILADLEDRRDLIMRREGVDAATADKMLEMEVRTTSGNAVKAKLRQILMDTDVIQRRVPDELAKQQAYYNSLSGAGKAMYKRFSKFGEPTEASAFRAVIQQADDFARAQAMAYLGRLEQAVRRVAPTGIMRLHADSAAMRDVFRVLGGEADTVTDATVAAVGQEFAEAVKGVAEYWRATGGILGNIENYYPIQHNADKMIAGGKQAWIEAWTQLNDLSKIQDFATGRAMTEARFLELAEQTWEDVTTNGASARERNAARRASGEGVTKRKLGGDLYASRAQSRFSRPVDVDTFLEYNNAFGVGDKGLYNMLVSSIAKMAHDAALMERLGPKPTTLFNSMQVRLQSVPNFPPTEITRVRAEMATLLGDWEGSSDSLLSRSIRAGQQFLSSALLGGAAVSGIGDLPFAAAAARARGVPALNAAGNWIGTLTQTAGRNADIRAYHIAESIQMSSMARFADESSQRADSIAYLINSKTHRVSGLNYITNTTADAGVLSFSAELARVIDIHGGDLAAIARENSAFAELLSRHDVTQADMHLIGKYGIDPNTHMVSKNLGLHAAADADDFELAAAAFRKVAGLEYEFRRAFTSAPDLQIRAWSSGRRVGGTVEGGAAHLIMSTLMMFKSWPMSVFMNHFVPAVSEALSGRAGNFFGLATSSMLMGSLVIQLKQKIKGETQYEWDNPILWKRAMYQSGFAGIVGDAMFGDYTSFGKSFVEAMAGPLPTTAVALVEPIIAATVDEVFTLDSNPDRFRDMSYDLTNAVSRVIPGQSLWFWRTWVDQNLRGGALKSIDRNRYEQAQAAKWRKKWREERIRQAQ